MSAVCEQRWIIVVNVVHKTGDKKVAVANKINQEGDKRTIRLNCERRS